MTASSQCEGYGEEEVKDLLTGFIQEYIAEKGFWYSQPFIDISTEDKWNSVRPPKLYARV